MLTPTRNFIVFLAKVLGASTRGMLQVPIMFNHFVMHIDKQIQPMYYML
jgi:hypothetical protein